MKEFDYPIALCIHAGHSDYCCVFERCPDYKTCEIGKLWEEEKVKRGVKIG